MKNGKRVLSLCLACIMGLSLMTAAFAAGEFSDVQPGAWYYDDVMECAGLGVVNGYNGMFNPNDPVTGVQFISMLTRIFYPEELDQIETPEGQPVTVENVQELLEERKVKYPDDTPYNTNFTDGGYGGDLGDLVKQWGANNTSMLLDLQTGCGNNTTINVKWNEPRAGGTGTKAADLTSGNFYDLAYTRCPE